MATATAVQAARSRRTWGWGLSLMAWRWGITVASKDRPGRQPQPVKKHRSHPVKIPVFRYALPTSLLTGERSWQGAACYLRSMATKTKKMSSSRTSGNALNWTLAPAPESKGHVRIVK